MGRMCICCHYLLYFIADCWTCRSFVEQVAKTVMLGASIGEKNRCGLSFFRYVWLVKGATGYAGLRTIMLNKLQCAVLRQVPTTGIFDECVNNCALYKEPADITLLWKHSCRMVSKSSNDGWSCACWGCIQKWALNLWSVHYVCRFNHTWNLPVACSVKILSLIFEVGYAYGWMYSWTESFHRCSTGTRIYLKIVYYIVKIISTVTLHNYLVTFPSWNCITFFLC